MTASRSRREGARARRWKLRRWKPRRERPGQAARRDGDRRSGLRRPSPPRSAAPCPEGFARPRSDGPGLSGRSEPAAFREVRRRRLRSGGSAVRSEEAQVARGRGRNWRFRGLEVRRGLRRFRRDHSTRAQRRGAALEGRRLRERSRSGRISHRVVIFGRFVGLRLRKLDGFAGQRGHLVGGTDATFRGGVGEGGGREPDRPWRRVL